MSRTFEQIRLDNIKARERTSARFAFYFIYGQLTNRRVVCRGMAGLRLGRSERVIRRADRVETRAKTAYEES